MLVSTRTTRTTRQCLCPLERLDNWLLAWGPIYLMRCIFPLDNILCRLDNACVHSYNPYDSTMLVSTRTTQQCSYDLYDSTKDSYGTYFGRHVSLIRCIFPSDDPRTRLDIISATSQIKCT